ncbi:MAG: glycosyltransferase [Bacteroidota bacterium]|uniref:glycosyltransferase n=1 Tax=Hydrotalea lipotrueae TaxID=2803817 RepID=UPI001C497691|nr:glycosyltransferase [Hydrotalea lipotrueae]
MRVAVIHDDLMRRGGGEQVALSIMKAFPDAELYTLCYQPELTYEEFRNYKIKTSIFQKFVKTEKMMKWLFFPFGLLAMKFLKVKGYDLVIISGTFCGKYANIDIRSRIFLYTYTPFRLAWNPTSYKEFNESSGLFKILFNLVIKCLRYVDKREAQKADHYIGMTEETAQRIRNAYGAKEVIILHPPVKCQNFHVDDYSKKSYYLVVSRLEFYKKVDLAIEAFNILGYPLVIVGNGSKKNELMGMANSNIQFKSGLTTSDLKKLYANCKAFIFPQHEDYGITPLEANASGRPVIAYGAGGVLETMLPYNTGNKKFTSVFFKEQTKEALIEAINSLETIDIDSNFIRNHAMRFDESVFIEKIIQIVQTQVS